MSGIPFRILDSLSILERNIHCSRRNRGIKTGIETTPLGPAAARVWGHKFFIGRIIIIFPHIGMLVLRPVMAGTNMKPEYIINRARLFSGIMTDAAIPLEITGMILETWKLLLTGWMFLSRVDKLSSILIGIPDM